MPNCQLPAGITPGSPQAQAYGWANPQCGGNFSYSAPTVRDVSGTYTISPSTIPVTPNVSPVARPASIPVSMPSVPLVSAMTLHPAAETSVGSMLTPAIAPHAIPSSHAAERPAFDPAPIVKGAAIAAVTGNPLDMAGALAPDSYAPIFLVLLALAAVVYIARVV